MLLPVVSQCLAVDHAVGQESGRSRFWKGAKEVANFAQTAASEALAGLVERVTFHNRENGFCVLRVKARGHRDLVTVVGRAALISAGEFIQMSGTWVNDRTHGQQFRASFLKTSPPTTLEGIERYLASGMIRGIGPIYAKRLVQGFGEAVFDLIEQQPDRLREVAGSAIEFWVLPQIPCCDCATRRVGREHGVGGSRHGRTLSVSAS